MNIGNRSLAEFLHDIERNTEYKKEIIFKIYQQERWLSIYYRGYIPPTDILNVFFYNDDFLINRSHFRKGIKCQIVITEQNWCQSGGELKPLPGSKTFIECEILKARDEFLKIKVLRLV